MKRNSNILHKVLTHQLFRHVFFKSDEDATVSDIKLCFVLKSRCSHTVVSWFRRKHMSHKSHVEVVKSFSCSGERVFFLAPMAHSLFKSKPKTRSIEAAQPSRLLGRDGGLLLSKTNDFDNDKDGSVTLKQHGLKTRTLVVTFTSTHWPMQVHAG